MSEYMWYPGSKFKLAKWIISQFPEHECYVEVFGGTGAVLLNKAESKVEIYNDYNGDLANLIMTIRDFPNQLRFELKDIPISREIYFDILEKWEKGEKGRNDIDRAARFFYIINCSFSGRPGSITLPGFRKDGRWMPKFLFDKLDAITEVAERLKKVFIESQDFRRIIEKFDCETTLFYCDPPYEDIRRVTGKHAGEEYYSSDFSKRDNIDLATLLHGIKGRAIVSGYRGFFDEIYGDWGSIEKEVIVSAGTGEKPKATEVLWMNFNLTGGDGFVNSKVRQKRLFE